jgi:hypothetical protein
MKISKLSLFLLPLLALSSCIKDDLLFDTVEPELRIISTLDSIGVEDTFQFEAMYLNNTGQEETVEVEWLSDDPDVLSIDEKGLARALKEGSVLITARFQEGDILLNDEAEVVVGANTVISAEERSGQISTTSSYELTGDFTIVLQGNDLVVSFAENYEASTALPGLYVYLTNNPNSIASALEVARVTTFSGEHTYTIPNVGIKEYNYLLYYCKPFNVKVGDGEIQ